jgi:hypothetical protein
MSAAGAESYKSSHKRIECIFTEGAFRRVEHIHTKKPNAGFASLEHRLESPTNGVHSSKIKPLYARNLKPTQKTWPNERLEGMQRRRGSQTKLYEIFW